MLLDITHERMQAEWWVVDNILSHRYVSECLRALVIPAGESTLQAASAISQPRQAALAAPDFPRSLAWMRHWRRDAQVSLLDGMLADRSLVK